MTMNLIYSSRAKNDLAKIDWRLREDIITKLDYTMSANDPSQFMTQLQNENLYKIEANKYVTVGRIINDSFSVVSILPKQTIKLPIVS